ncbi:MAG: conjugal transfer protein TraF, partial [Planctomycetes bacterium]|nr:conjugal transfer protein TraF [Planctomycetota bacterium]
GGAGFDLDFSLSGAGALTDGGVAELLGTIGTGNAPTTPGGTALAARLDGIGAVTAAQANELAFQAEQAGLDLSDEAVRNMLSDLIEATEANSGGSSGNTFGSNASSVTLQGIALKEAGVTGAIPLGSRLRLGLTLKSLEGTTFARTISYRTIQDGESLSEEIDDRDTLRENTRTSTEFDFDAGVQLKILPALWVGVSGRNLASPEFPFLGGDGHYELAPQVRAGIALAPFGERLVLAAEGDVLTNTSDALPGFRSRQGAVGVEFAPFQNRLLALALRGGARQDLEAEHDDIVFSTGLGMNLLGVNLALAADIAADKTDIEKAAAGNGTDAKEIPSAAGLTAEIGWGRRF